MGPKQQRSGRKAAEPAEGAGGDAGTCASRREASLPQAGLLVLRGQLRPGPATPAPRQQLQHHPAGRGRDVTAASRRLVPQSGLKAAGWPRQRTFGDSPAL